MNNDEWYQFEHGAIKKLDQTNYTEWKRDVRSALTVEDAFRIVTGEEPEPPAGKSRDARVALDSYRKRRALAAQVLIYSTKPTIRLHVIDMDDPSEIWQTLAERLDFTKTQVGRDAVLNKFMSARPETGEGIGGYIARLRSYQAQLIETTTAISDDMIKARIYATAPSEFKTLITILRHREGDITVEGLISKLTEDEEERRIASIASGVALYARGGQRGRGQDRGRGGNRNRSDRRQPEQQLASSESKKRKHSDLICYHCGEIGHIRSDCELKKRADEAVKRHKHKRFTRCKPVNGACTNEPTGSIQPTRR